MPFSRTKVVRLENIASKHAKKCHKRFDKQTKRGKMINPIEWNSIVSSWRGTINTRHAPPVAHLPAREFPGRKRESTRKRSCKIQTVRINERSPHIALIRIVKEANHAESRHGYKDVSRAQFVSIVSRELYANWMVRSGALPRIVFVRPGFCGRGEGRKNRDERKGVGA